MSGVKTDGGWGKIGFDNSNWTQHIVTGLATGISEGAGGGMLGDMLEQGVLTAAYRLSGGKGFKTDYSKYNWNAMAPGAEKLGNLVGGMASTYVAERVKKYDEERNASGMPADKSDPLGVIDNILGAAWYGIKKAGEYISDIKNSIKDYAGGVLDDLGLAGAAKSIAGGLGTALDFSRDLFGGLDKGTGYAGGVLGDTIKNSGEVIANLGRNIIDGEGIHWETNAGRSVRHYYEMISEEDNESDSFGSSKRDKELTKHQKEKMIERMQNGESFIDDEVLNLSNRNEFNQDDDELLSGAGKRVKSIFEAIQKNPDSLQFDEKMQRDIENLQNKDKLDKKEKEALAGFLMIKEKFEKVKNYIVSGDLNTISNETKDKLCYVIAHWQAGVVSGKEGRSFNAFFVEELQKGMIGSYNKEKNTANAYIGGGGDEWRKNYGMTNKIDNLLSKNDSKDSSNWTYSAITADDIKTLNESGKNYALIWKTPLNSPESGRGGHWAVAYKNKKNQWIDADHTRIRDRNQQVKWNQVLRIYY